jgi:hypothetical protein
LVRPGRLASYTVKAKDGSDRPATLRDARKLNLVPSVTAIIKCAAAPGLQYWMQKQVMLAALTLPKVDGETEDAYLSRILNDSKEQARKAAERGTAIHAAIQGFYEDETPTPGYEPYIQGACKAVSDWGGTGTVDRGEVLLSSSGLRREGGPSRNRRCGVIDFKTKEFDTKATT